MPNHVRNILSISGVGKKGLIELKRFKDLMHSDTNPALKEHYKKSLECRIDLCKKKEGPFNASDLKEAEKALASLDSFQTHFTFNATVPKPPELSGTSSPCPKEGFEAKFQKECQKKFGAGNWYDWETKNWGVKWGAYNEGEWVDEDGGLAIEFDTAWSPPDTWLYQTAKLFPRLTFVDNWHSEGGETGRLTVEVVDGQVEMNHEDMEEHDWFMENDGMYRDEYEMVTQEDYKQAVKDVLEGNEPFGWYHNEELFLNRLEPKDLPLFVNFEWMDRDLFENKMKEVL